MDILEKLEKQLSGGVDTEGTASYLLIEIRKFLEQRGLKENFNYLKFYCDWAAHASLAGPMAQKVLEQFDEAAVQLKTGIEMHQLPHQLQREIDQLSKFRSCRADNPDG